jgi:hypothetical protein
MIRPLISRVPVGFIDVSQAIVHAVSPFTRDPARFVTGRVLLACGGPSLNVVDPGGRPDAPHRPPSNQPDPQP